MANHKHTHRTTLRFTTAEQATYTHAWQSFSKTPPNPDAEQPTHLPSPSHPPLPDAPRPPDLAPPTPSHPPTPPSPSPTTPHPPERPLHHLEQPLQTAHETIAILQTQLHNHKSTIASLDAKLWQLTSAGAPLRHQACPHCGRAGQQWAGGPPQQDLVGPEWHDWGYLAGQRERSKRCAECNKHLKCERCDGRAEGCEEEGGAAGVAGHEAVEGAERESGEASDGDVYEGLERVKIDSGDGSKEG